MPATRISKNSSRLLLTMQRKRRRSSSGTAVSCASARTRRLKASSESSRLISCGAAVLTGGWGGIGLSRRRGTGVAANPPIFADLGYRHVTGGGIGGQRQPQAGSLGVAIELDEVGMVRGELVRGRQDDEQLQR